MVLANVASTLLLQKKFQNILCVLSFRRQKCFLYMTAGPHLWWPLPPTLTLPLGGGREGWG